MNNLTLRFLLGQKCKKEELAIFPLILLCTLVFCNLNGILSSITGISALGSPLILLCCILIFALIPTFKTTFKVPLLLVVLSLITFCGVAIISSFTNFYEISFELNSILRGVREILTAIILLFTFYAYARFHNTKYPDKDFLSFVFIFFLITLIAGVFESQLGLRNTLYLSTDPNRSLGFFGNPNETGLQANLTAVIAYYLYYIRKIPVWIFLPTIFLSILGSIMSFSKTAIITSVLLLILYLFILIVTSLSLKSGKRNFLTFLVFILIGSGVFNLFLIPKYETLDYSQKRRIEDVIRLAVYGKFDNRTTSSRAGVFTDAINRIKQKPVLGFGLGAFTRGGLFQSSPTHGVHNLYLRIMGDSGIIPFIFMAIVFIYLLVIGALFSSNNSFVLILLFSISLGLYCIASHNVFGKKFLISLWGIVLFYNYKFNPHKKLKPTKS